MSSLTIEMTNPRSVGSHWPCHDRITSIKGIKPYDPTQPQAKIDEGHD